MTTGWRTEKLGDACAFLNRGAAPKYLDEGGISVLGQRCVRDHRVDYQFARRHDADAKPVGAGRFVELGDVLVNSTGVGSLGRVAQIRETPPEPTTVDSHMTIVRPTPGKFFLDFFGYMLMAIEEAITAAGAGCGGQTELSRRALADEFLVSYPTSVDEQQRLVAILDETFEGITTARRNAKRNLRNARALFESRLQSVFSPHHAEDIAPIGEIAEVFDGPHATPKTVDSGPVFLGISALQDGIVNLVETRHVSPTDFVTWTRRVRPQPDDVVFSYETRLGQAAIIPDGLECCLGRRMGLIRLNRDRVNPHFFVYQYISPPFRRFLETRTIHGATVDRLAIREVPAFSVWLPEVDEQDHIVAALDDVRSATRRLEVVYERKLAALDELKRSFLHQAFRGQL